MAARRSLEERAADAERKNKWLKAELAAEDRPEVAVLFGAVRRIDGVIEALDGASPEVRAALIAARNAAANSLGVMGVDVP